MLRNTRETNHSTDYHVLENKILTERISLYVAGDSYFCYESKIILMLK